MFNFSCTVFIFRLLFFIWICKAARKCGINYRGNHLLFYHFLLVPAKIKMGISMFRDLNVRHDSNSIWKKTSQSNVSTHIEKTTNFRYYPFRLSYSSISYIFPLQRFVLIRLLVEWNIIALFLEFKYGRKYKTIHELSQITTELAFFLFMPHKNCIIIKVV